MYRRDSPQICNGIEVEIMFVWGHKTRVKLRYRKHLTISKYKLQCWKYNKQNAYSSITRRDIYSKDLFSAVGFTWYASSETYVDFMSSTILYTYKHTHICIYSKHRTCRHTRKIDLGDA